jgi:endonuclease V-like protein UPF0215 family
MKEYPIIIGFDDAQFNFNSEAKTTKLIGVVCQGTRMVGVVGDEIEIDGNDATDKLIKLVNQVEKHVQYIVTQTITFGGFNLVDLTRIYEETKKPVIAITETEPDFDSVISALKKKFPDSYQEKMKKILAAGKLFETEVETAGGITKIFFHCKGIELQEVDSLLKKICIDSKLPEPVRMAHLIGRLF